MMAAAASCRHIRFETVVACTDDVNGAAQLDSAKGNIFRCVCGTPTLKNTGGIRRRKMNGGRTIGRYGHFQHESAVLFTP